MLERLGAVSSTISVWPVPRAGAQRLGPVGRTAVEDAYWGPGAPRRSVLGARRVHPADGRVAAVAFRRRAYRGAAALARVPGRRDRIRDRLKTDGPLTTRELGGAGAANGGTGANRSASSGCWTSGGRLRPPRRLAARLRPRRTGVPRALAQDLDDDAPRPSSPARPCPAWRHAETCRLLPHQAGPGGPRDRRHRTGPNRGRQLAPAPGRTPRPSPAHRAEGTSRRCSPVQTPRLGQGTGPRSSARLPSEAYVPAKRVHGCAMPLFGGRLLGRVDPARGRTLVAVRRPWNLGPPRPAWRPQSRPWPQPYGAPQPGSAATTFTWTEPTSPAPC